MRKRKNFDSYLRQFRKINLRKIMDLNVKSKIQKNIEYFHNFGFSFLPSSLPPSLSFFFLLFSGTFIYFFKQDITKYIISYLQI